MDIMQIGTDILKSKLGGSGGASNEVISGALGKLVGSGDNLDLGGLMSSLQSGGLASMAASWLGDGDNDSISVDQIKGLLGGDKIAAAATELGTDENSLLSSLSQALPQMVNNASSGGSLLDSIGGIGGALNMAKKLF